MTENEKIQISTNKFAQIISIYKITPFISEIKKFFNNKELTEAMQNITGILSGIRMTEKSTLGLTKKRNTFYRSLSVFQCLMVLPYIGGKNIFNSRISSAKVLIHAQKDVFYRFVSNQSVTWRKALWSISSQLWNKISFLLYFSACCEPYILDF